MTSGAPMGSKSVRKGRKNIFFTEDVEANATS